MFARLTSYRSVDFKKSRYASLPSDPVDTFANLLFEVSDIAAAGLGGIEMGFVSKSPGGVLRMAPKTCWSPENTT